MKKVRLIVLYFTLFAFGSVIPVYAHEKDDHHTGLSAIAAHGREALVLLIELLLIGTVVYVAVKLALKNK